MSNKSAAAAASPQLLSSLQVSSSNAASTPTQAPAAAVGASSGSGQGDLDLFSDSSSTTKTDDVAKKPLSKDSILSLYGTNSMSHQAPAGEDHGASKSMNTPALVKTLWAGFFLLLQCLLFLSDFIFENGFWGGSSQRKQYFHEAKVDVPSCEMSELQKLYQNIWLKWSQTCKVILATSQRRKPFKKALNSIPSPSVNVENHLSILLLNAYRTPNCNRLSSAV